MDDDEGAHFAGIPGADGYAIGHLCRRVPEAEDFETITRRVVAERPEALQTFGNKLNAIRNFLTIPFTFGTNPEEIERRAEHVLLKSPTFDRDSQSWVETHDPAAGYVPDRPSSGSSPVTLAQ